MLLIPPGCPFIFPSFLSCSFDHEYLFSSSVVIRKRMVWRGVFFSCFLLMLFWSFSLGGLPQQCSHGYRTSRNIHHLRLKDIKRHDSSLERHLLKTTNHQENFRNYFPSLPFAGSIRIKTRIYWIKSHLTWTSKYAMQDKAPFLPKKKKMFHKWYLKLRLAEPSEITHQTPIPASSRIYHLLYSLITKNIPPQHLYHAAVQLPLYAHYSPAPPQKH